MSETLFSGGERLPRQNRDIGPTELPEVKVSQTAVDKEAIAERIIDRVIDAAEHDEPIEGQYERSHEVKDVGQAAISFAPMQSVGAILEEQQQAMRPSGTQFVDPSGAATVNFQEPVRHGQKVSYNRAIVYGVIAALTVIISISVYLLIK